MCQVFNLTENQTDWLARHLGHDIRVHKDFYRLHDNAVELAKVSRLLIAVDRGQAEKFAGKALEDINIAGVFVINVNIKILTNLLQTYQMWKKMQQQMQCLMKKVLIYPRTVNV